jgi:hypothetical protein
MVFRPGVCVVGGIVAERMRRRKAERWAMKAAWLSIGAGAMVLLAGCAPVAPRCLLPSQKPMLMIDLFFGRDIAGRGAVTDAEWEDFTRREITPRFPDGFTVIDARGQWLDPGANTIGLEASKMVRIGTVADAGTAARVTAVVDAYRRRFRQQAVGVTSFEACAAF